jgi:signal transduction histidine kinase
MLQPVRGIADPDTDADADAELRGVRRRIIEAGDAARRELARDLHDGAQQQIVITVINLQRAQQKWDSDPARARELLDAGLEAAQLGLDALRELVAGIHPPILATRGLNDAVEDLTKRMGMPVDVVLPEERLDPGLEASVYFFISEALSNVMKHSKAANAWVLVSLSDGSIVVEVRDDGVGGAKVIDAGTGLLGLGDRIDAVDGKLTVTSPDGGGTTLHALIRTAPAKLL